MPKSFSRSADMLNPTIIGKYGHLGNHSGILGKYHGTTNCSNKVMTSDSITPHTQLLINEMPNNGVQGTRHKVSGPLTPDVRVKK